jgi:Flp pilus assembly pilin Flp
VRPRRSETFAVLLRRFFREESGGAGLQYVLFTTCWSIAVSGGLFFGAPMMTAKLEAVSAAVRGGPYR